MLLSLGPSLSAMAAKQEVDPDVRREESEDHFKNWLERDAVYIITDDEKSVFAELTTEDEKERFIEQFWRRRDPDPRTALNEYKEEHYRRIAYANERFHSGKEGWRSDRGRVYIVHGEPAEIESYAAGSFYDREFEQGGGQTTVYAFERWRYRHLDGIGDDIELEFVDSSFTGDYHLALNPEEKDALLHMPGQGLTWSEQVGLTRKEDRPYFSPGRHNPAYNTGSFRNNPFYRYEIFSNVQTPKKIKYNDLKELVKINIGYSNLAFEARSDYFKLNRQKILVPVTLQLQNKDMTFKRKGNLHSARIGLYGAVTSLDNRLIQEFDDELVISYAPEVLERSLQGRSMYQKVLILDNKTRYKLDLVVKDIGSGNIGAVKQAIIPPPSLKEGEKLSNSSLILSDFIRKLDVVPEDNQMFVLGDVKIRPSMDKSFSAKSLLAVYLHLYNFGLDQSSNAPNLQVRYRISRGGDLVHETTDNNGESVQFSSPERLVLVKGFHLRGLEPGTYRMEVEAWDQLNDTKTQVGDSFRVKGG
jgi:GWxTD domain-containing protein